MARRAAWRLSVDVTAAATQAQVDIDQHSGSRPLSPRPARRRRSPTRLRRPPVGTLTDRRRDVHASTADAGGAADGAEGNQADDDRHHLRCRCGRDQLRRRHEHVERSASTQADGRRHDRRTFKRPSTAAADFTASGGTRRRDTVAGYGTIAGTDAGGRDAGSAVITITVGHAPARAANGKTVTITESTAVTTAGPDGHRRRQRQHHGAGQRHRHDDLDAIASAIDGSGRLQRVARRPRPATATTIAATQTAPGRGQHCGRRRGDAAASATTWCSSWPARPARKCSASWPARASRELVASINLVQRRHRRRAPRSTARRWSSRRRLTAPTRSSTSKIISEGTATGRHVHHGRRQRQPATTAPTSWPRSTASTPTATATRCRSTPRRST